MSYFAGCCLPQRNFLAEGAPISFFFCCLFRSDGQEELHQEDQAQHVGQDGNFLGLAGNELDDGEADQGQA